MYYAVLLAACRYYKKRLNVFNRESFADEIKTVIAALLDIEFKQVVLNCEDSLKSDILSSEIALPVIKNDISHSVGFNECLKAESLQHLNSFAAAIGAALCLANNSNLIWPGIIKQFQSAKVESIPRCRCFCRCFYACLLGMAISGTFYSAAAVKRN